MSRGPESTWKTGCLRLSAVDTEGSDGGGVGPGISKFLKGKHNHQVSLRSPWKVSGC